MISPAEVRFSLRDPEHRLRAVRLWQEVLLPGELLEFTWTDGRWTLRVPRPAVDRMEYLFELTHADGTGETICDPEQHVRVGGAFGDHSVVEFPGYHAPGWLSAPVAGSAAPLDIDTGAVRERLTGSLWTPDGLTAGTRAPLLLVHDGPEYDSLAGLTRYLGAMVGAGAIPPVRAALLAPGPRDDWYSASGAYNSALISRVLPALRAQVAVGPVIGMGASLGALQMLLAQRFAGAGIDGLFLQSGSYFQASTDPSERGFGEFDRIVRSVAGVLASAGSRHPVPVRMTCGGIEENLANNRAMGRALRAQGYDVVLHEVRDVHNYTAWRDTFDPYLTGLIRAVCREVTTDA